MRLLAACLLAARAQAECDFKDDIQALLEGDASKAAECGAQMGTQQIEVKSSCGGTTVCQFAELVRCIPDANRDCSEFHDACRGVRSEMDVRRPRGRPSPAHTARAVAKMITVISGHVRRARPRPRGGW